jgi:hypothetical protein
LRLIAHKDALIRMMHRDNYALAIKFAIAGTPLTQWEIAVGQYKQIPEFMNLHTTCRIGCESSYGGALLLYYSGNKYIKIYNMQTTPCLYIVTILPIMISYDINTTCNNEEYYSLYCRLSSIQIPTIDPQNDIELCAMENKLDMKSARKICYTRIDKKVMLSKIIEFYNIIARVQ